MSHTVLQAQVNWFKNTELDKQLLEAPGLDEGGLANKRDPLVIVPYIMESLLNMIYSEQNIYNTQSQHFLVKLKSKLQS